MQGVIPKTIRRIYDIIRENTGNITGLDIKGADAGVMIQKTDADGAMLPEPVRSSVERSSTDWADR